MIHVAKPSEFLVLDCVTHFFEKDRRWFWYCLTCDTGSDKHTQRYKRRRGPGHRTDVAAAEGATTHAADMKRNRQVKLWNNEVWRRISVVEDLAEFKYLWFIRHPDTKNQIAPATLSEAVMDYCRRSATDLLERENVSNANDSARV